MFKDENKSSSLARFLSGFDYAFVDTCSLMEDSFAEWMDILVNAKEYLAESLHIVVINKCVQELKKHAKDKKDNTKRIAAKRALKILRLVKWKKILEITKKEKNQNFADNVIYTTVSNLRITKKCLVITQDKKLATDLMNLNDLSSQKGRPVSVFKLGNEGSLAANRGEIVKKQFEFHQKNQANKQFAKTNKPQQQPKEVSKQEAKPKSAILADPKKKILEDDSNLNSKLNDPNYPKDKKIADIHAQQKALAQYGDVKSLNLLLSPEKLANEVAILEGKTNKPSEKKEPAPAKKGNDVKKEEKPVMPSKKLWYEYGPTIEIALNRVLQHHEIMVRDDSVPFIPMIHGTKDFTSSDLSEVVAQLSKGNASYVYKQMKFIAEKSEKGYKAMIDFDMPAPEPAKENKSETEPEAKKEPKKPAKAKKTKAKEPTKKDENPVEPKKESKAKKPAKKAESKKAEEPKEEIKATLVVAIPDDEKEAAKIEKKVKKSTNKAPVEPKKTEKKEKPAQAKAKKTEKPSKKAEPKPVENQAKVKDDVTKTSDKPKAKKATKKETKSPLDEALAAEKVFSANINNPNYPAEKKKAALQKQIDLVSKVDPKDRNKLSFTIDSLKAMLAILG